MIAMNNMRHITELKENQVFIFGSNLQGNHAGGAAKQALDHFGARQGQAIGFQGQSYAIPTLDARYKKIPLEEIKKDLELLVKMAELYSEKEFLLTPIGTGIAGYSMKDLENILPALPSNIIPLWKKN
jgi:hypothetical protein